MKRPIIALRKNLCVFLFLLANSLLAQTGVVTGIIEDDTGPLPGVNITIKGKSNGTQTDFDGYYRLGCEVGDTLVFAYIGFATREVIVTASMFGAAQTSNIVRQVAVAPILNRAYQDSVRKKMPVFLQVPSIEESAKVYQGKSYFNPYRLKDIRISGNQVVLDYLDEDIFFEVGLSSFTSAQFVRTRNLPRTQQVFSQGAPINGENTYLGPETDTPYSYGPRLITLEFDGISYPYDTNGKLVPKETGNGKSANSYDNSIFRTAVRTTNRLFFNMLTNDHFFELDHEHTTYNDLYGKERSKQSKSGFNYRREQGYNIEWDILLKHSKLEENQPNINGFNNSILFNTLVAPVSFENQQGSFLANRTQRSFSSSNFNNPFWLLSNNRNRLIKEQLVAAIKNRFRLTDNFELKSNFSFTKSKEQEQFGVYRGTVGFLEGYASNKDFKKDAFDANIILKWSPYINSIALDFNSSLFYDHQNLAYRFVEGTRFDAGTFENPRQEKLAVRNLRRTTFRWFNRIDMGLIKNKLRLALINNSFSSDIQESNWFLPKVQISYSFAKNWYSDAFTKLKLSVSYGTDVNYLPLYYPNQSHNSLLISAEQSLGYTTNNDLFVSGEVALEQKRSYEVGMDWGFNLFNENWDFNATYFQNRTKGSVFPVWESNQFQLRNSADIQDDGIEISLQTNLYNSEKVNFKGDLIFSKNRTKVLTLLSPASRIPIAGFSNISKNLIQGKSAGVLVGTAYARDDKGTIRIDAEGFPLVADELQVIGDPTPDFNLGFSGTLSRGKFAFDFVIDYQKGGAIWNGTQQTLNYYGTSVQSAEQRAIRGFTFEGVNPQGNTNTTMVDFANPENGLGGNRFVRYGFGGIAEEAIEEGDYLNLKSIALSYNLTEPNEGAFFRQLKFEVYGTNLLTLSKFDGAAPYSTLYDQTSSQGIHFFNSPILSEVGLKIFLKI